MGGKTQKTTTNQSTAPPADVMAQYQALLKRASGVSQDPTQAPTTGLQTQAWNSFGQIPGQYAGQAQAYATQAGAPIDAADAMARYGNPYQKDVIEATRKNLQETFGEQANQVKGNAIAQGALGGDREGVAQGELARQQGLAAGQTFAGLDAQNYNQAIATAEANRAAAGQGAGIEAGLQNTAIQGAGAELAAGTQQQQVNQAQLTQPYQQAQWLAGITGAIAPQEGTNTTGTTTAPGPTFLQQIAGIGLTGLGVAGGLGWQPFKTAAAGGRIPSFADGGGIAPNPRVHEMMRNAIALAQGVKQQMQPAQAYGGPVMPGIAVRGYDDGGGVFPSWMFDPSQATAPVPSGGNSPIEVLERGTGKVLSGVAPTVAPPKQITDRVPLSAPVAANVTPQTGVTRGIAPSAGPPPPLNMDAAGMSGSDAGIHPTGAPPVQMAQGLNGGPSGNPPITLDKISVVGKAPPGQGGPGGIAPPGTVPYDTSGQSPQVASGIAAKAQAQGAPSWSLPLIAAGLGMLASKSPFFGVALGEGGLQGVKTFQDQQQQQRTYDLEAQKLSNQASQFQQTFGLQSAEAAKPVLAGYGPDGFPVYEQLNKDTGKYEPANLGAAGADQPPAAPLAPPEMLSKYNLVGDDKEAQKFSAVPEMYRQDAAGLLTGTKHIADIPAIVRMGGVSIPMRSKAINYAKSVDPTYDEQAERSGQSLESSPKAQQYVANVRRVMDTANHFAELSDKVDRSNFTFANNGLLALKAGVSDPDTLALMSDYTILADEAGKILGSGQGSDFAIKLGQSLVNPAASKTGVKAQLNEIQGRLQNTLVHEKEQFRQNPAKWAPPDATAAAGSAVGPSGKSLSADVQKKVDAARKNGWTEDQINAELAKMAP